MTVLYSSDTCSYCPMMKRYLKHFGVDFIEKSVSDPANAKEAMRLSGAMTVPILVMDEPDRKGVVIGYSPSKLSSLLRISA